MGFAEISALAGHFGPAGLVVGYLVWRELRADRLAEKRIAADTQLATALALLDATIRGGRH